MIFVLRVIIFCALILAGFAVSVRSLAGRKAVTVIYNLTVLWYCFFCRLSIFISVPAYGDDIVPAVSAPSSPSLWERIIRLAVHVFGSQPDGTLAGGGIVKAMVFNALLFVPLGFLLLLWLPRLRKGWRGAVLAVAVTAAVSICIEAAQAVTSLGMADIKDVLGNALGGAAGVGMMKLYDRLNRGAGGKIEFDHRTV